jgi:hypothetical protein
VPRNGSIDARRSTGSYGGSSSPVVLLDPLLLDDDEDVVVPGVPVDEPVSSPAGTSSPPQAHASTKIHRDRTPAVSRESPRSATQALVWTVPIASTPDRRTLQGEVRLGPRAATVAEVLDGWRDDVQLRTAFNDALAKAPFQAFRWETPAVTRDSLSRAFEFVVLDAPSLAIAPEPEVFAEHFTSKSPIVVFPNLGRDAILVVPTQLGPASAYGHVAAFVRHAPAAQRDALWREVAIAMHQRVSAKPVWLSTAGGGVAWLHVRLLGASAAYPCGHGQDRLGRRHRTRAARCVGR